MPSMNRKASVAASPSLPSIWTTVRLRTASVSTRICALAEPPAKGSPPMNS
jgi:hypothetical protein